MRVQILACALLSAACSTLGDPGGAPEALPHGGTGQFRLLDTEETGITGFPGRALVLRDIAIEAAMPAGGFIFYAQARALDMPPPRPEDYPRNEIFWDTFEPRTIHAGAAREEGVGAFAPGPLVLAASESWEGEDVFDPWVVVAEDGSARLYYAAAGGIGVAESPAADGPYTRVGTGPILGPDAAASGAPRRPSVVLGPDGAWWMYYDAGGELRAARSEDGLAFTAMGPLTIEGEDTGDGIEVGMASPGAVAVQTRAGRTLVRLYFESIREGVTEDVTAGSLGHVPYAAGSEDGLTFVRHPRPLLEQVDIRFPAPLLVDDIVTLLYGNIAFIGGSHQTRGLLVGVSPAGTSYAPPEE